MQSNTSITPLQETIIQNAVEAAVASAMNQTYDIARNPLSAIGDTPLQDIAKKELEYAMEKIKATFITTPF